MLMGTFKLMGVFKFMMLSFWNKRIIFKLNTSIKISFLFSRKQQINIHGWHGHRAANNSANTAGRRLAMSVSKTFIGFIGQYSSPFPSPLSVKGGESSPRPVVISKHQLPRKIFCVVLKVQKSNGNVCCYIVFIIILPLYLYDFRPDKSMMLLMYMLPLKQTKREYRSITELQTSCI